MKYHSPDVAQHDALRDSAALGPASPSSRNLDVTASTPPTPSSNLEHLEPANFEIIWADSASELSDDWLDVAQDPHTIQDSPSALDARAMAEDFSEGRLETFVGSPQKELAGTQNAYVSYLVTTKV
jgi:sorting nexin-4